MEARRQDSMRLRQKTSGIVCSTRKLTWYFGAACCGRRRTIDLWTTVVILAFSLGPILGLHFFVQHPYNLQIVLAAIAVLSVVQVVLGLTNAANDMVSVHGECS